MSKHLHKRAGFTLLELLVVLSILAILIALSMAAVMRIRISQQVRSSSDVVEKVQLAVDNQYKAIIAQAQTDIRGQSTQDAQAMINYFGTVGGDVDSALALLTYCRVRQSFPQTFAEVQPFTVAGFTYPVKSQFLPFVGATAPPGLQSASQQSAILLYAAVSQTGAGGSVFSSDATNSANKSFQIGSVTASAYMDAWQQPIGFCRFGINVELGNPPFVTGKVMPGALIPYMDPLDPSGKLYNWANNNGATSRAQATNFAANLFVNNGDLANSAWFDATNRRPVVYSNGLNQVYESLDNAPVSTTSSQPKDDILGYRLTQLGQKGTQ